MKVYIVSSDRLSGISAANLLNRRQNMNAILSESEIDEYADEIDEVERNIGRGFDYILLISSKPYEASIDINKEDNARAVVCQNRAELSAANGQAKANVIVLDRTKGKNVVLELVEEFIDIAYGSQPEGTVIEEREEKPSVADSAFGFMKRIKESVPQPKERPQVYARNDQKRRKQKKQQVEEEGGEENEEETDDDKGYSGKGGILGRIKYTFGIED